MRSKLRSETVQKEKDSHFSYAINTLKTHKEDLNEDQIMKTQMPKFMSTISSCITKVKRHK